jgi:SAM-dependent methyltransferase
MKLEQLYRHRFDERELPRRMAIWRVLCDDYFAKFVTPNDTVVDIGAGYCEFINNIRCRHRIAVDINPRTAELAAPGVEVRRDDCRTLASIGDASVDVVFMSNFLEHLPNKEAVYDTLSAAVRILRPGGRLIILQPNVRLLPGRYWDFFDHHTPLTEHSLVEALSTLAVRPVHVVGRFLPYTTKSRLPQAPWIVRLYLRLPPLWLLFGRQSLVIAEKP